LNKIKLLKVTIILSQLFSLLFIGLSLHTLVTVSLATISPETFNFIVNVDESTGDLFVGLDGNLTNDAFLAVNLFFEVAVLNSDGQSIVKNSTSLNINAGNMSPFSINLRVPTEMAWNIDLEQNIGTLELTFTMRTLGDLVGFTDKMVITGGGEN
jgi:hypothetical protein